MPSALLVSYPNAMNDPTPRNAAESLRDAGYAVTVVTCVRAGTVRTPPPAGIVVREVGSGGGFDRLGRLASLVRWWAFRSAVRRGVREVRPDVVVAVMFHAIAALPDGVFAGPVRTVACVYDISRPEDCGRLDGPIVRLAYDRLRRFRTVWASDPCKAELTAEFARLPTRPLVCLNCPTTGYMAEPLWPRDGWLRDRLRADGLSLPADGGCVIVRAGALGEHCGIDESLSALSRLPSGVTLLLMGRPSPDYAAGLRDRIRATGLGGRVAFWDRPTDDDWDKALRGADVGHLIHGPYPPGPAARSFALNSSLSNYRLYNYMAAGLPILSYDDDRLAPVHAAVPCVRVCRLDRLADDLTTHIAELASDPTGRETLGRVGRAAHLSGYNWAAQFAPVLAHAGVS